MSHFAVTTLAALLLAAAPLPQKKTEEKDPTQPVLVVCHLDEQRHPVYFVHAVPQAVLFDKPSPAQ